MIPLEQRKNLLSLVDEAITSGARQRKACEIVGIAAKTLQRWRQPDDLQDDGRKSRQFIPPNKLSDEERQQILDIVNSGEYADKTPNQIVPILAEKGEFIASERSFYRVLKTADQLEHRYASKPAIERHKPRALCATGPGQLLSWDITYLKTTIVGMFFYLYLFIDVFSRKIVGWQIHDCECNVLAADIIRDIALREGYDINQVDLHSDNGGPMKGATLMAMLQMLGITPSYSRPSVSNDNPYSESLFKTVKYCPYYPEKPFADLLEARRWMIGFVDWYNNQHRHSGISYVTPAQRHAGLDKAILVKRAETYEMAKAKNPSRWSGETRDWTWQDAVLLNPDQAPEKADGKELKLSM